MANCCLLARWWRVRILSVQHNGVCGAWQRKNNVDRAAQTPRHRLRANVWKMHADYIASSIVPVAEFKLRELNSRRGDVADAFFATARQRKAAGAHVGVPAGVVEGVTIEGVIPVKVTHAADNFGLKCAACACIRTDVTVCRGPCQVHCDMLTLPKHIWARCGH